MAVEVAPVGREGMVGLPVFLGVTASPNHVFAQIPGASGTGTRRARQVRLDCDALRLETYIQYATRDGDSELADLFRKAQAYSREGAEIGKQLLRSRLASSYDRFRDGLPAHPPRQGAPLVRDEIPTPNRPGAWPGHRSRRARHGTVWRVSRATGADGELECGIDGHVAVMPVSSAIRPISCLLATIAGP